MPLRYALLPIVALTASAFAADLPAVPTAPIAKKKELLFSDDFQGAEPAKVWHNPEVLGVRRPSPRSSPPGTAC